MAEGEVEAGEAIGIVDFGSMMGVDYMESAAAALEAHDYDKAAELAEKAVEHERHNPQALELRGKARYYQAKLKGCIKDFNAALKLDSKLRAAKQLGKRAQRLFTLSKKGMEFFNAGKYEEADKVYEEALQVDPDNDRMNARTYTNRAAAMEKMERHADAVDAYSHALLCGGDPQYSFFRRGLAHKKLEKYLESVYDMEYSYKFKKTRETENHLRELKLLCTHYAVLGLDPENCTEKDVKKKYYLLARKWHPDKDTSDNERATVLFRKINKAYNVLMDSAKRAEYDKFLVQAKHREEERLEAEAERKAQELWSPTLEGYRALNRDYMAGSMSEESEFSDENEEEATSNLLKKGLQVLKPGMTAQALYNDGEWHPVVVDQYLYLTKSYFVTFLEFDEQEMVRAEEIRTTDVTLVDNGPKRERKRKRKWDQFEEQVKKLMKKEASDPDDW